MPLLGGDGNMRLKLWVLFMMGLSICCMGGEPDNAMFATNRVQLWQRVKDLRGMEGNKCRYIDNVPVIPVTKRTSKAATATTGILYYMNTVGKNAAPLFMVLSAKNEAGIGPDDKAQLAGLGLNPDSKDTEEMGLDEETALLLGEKMNERMQQMQTEEDAAGRETHDAIDIQAAAKGREYLRGSPLGVQYSRIVAKHLGASTGANEIATNLARFAANRGCKFDVEVKQPADFAAVRSYITNGSPVLLKCGTGEFFTVTGYLDDIDGKCLIVHDGGTATCKWDKTGEGKVIADDNIGNLKGDIFPGCYVPHYLRNFVPE
jgi:hypothetical protein